MPLRTADVLILGQGLAGSTLAWRLAERGVSVIVIDRGGIDERGRPSASNVAAGLITPVTGKRLTVAEDYAKHWQSAREFYRRVEAETGVAILNEGPAIRVFVDDAEREAFDRRTANVDFRQHARSANEKELPGACEAVLGAFVMPNAARLDVPAYLEATAAWLGDRLIRSACDVRRDLRIDGTGVTVERLSVAAGSVVLCQGHAATPCRWLDGVNFSPAKGEVLTIHSPTLQADQVIHSGVWIAPEGGDRYRVGSTTEWHWLDSTPTKAGRRDLLARLTAAGVTDAEVVDHQAAIRPATPDRQPTYGFCPDEPRIGWFNGLGAKGSLWAPWHAERMAESVVRVIG